MYEAIDNFIINLYDLSKTGMVVILGILVVRFLLRKAPKKYSYFLWIIVAIRLLCPFSFESIFSIFNVEKVVTPLVSNGSIVDNVVTYIQPYYYENRLLEFDSTYIPNDLQVLDYTFFKFNIWILVVFLILLYVYFSYSDVHLLTKYAIRLKDNIYQGEKIKSPFVFGFLKPKIYIPYHLDEQTQDIIIKHESYHIKRKDHLLRFLALGICTIYWFNPFVWLAYKLFIEDMEMSCDEYVLLNKDNKTYSSTLLSFATDQFSKPKPLAFGESVISKRIKNCLKWKSPNKKTMILSLCFSLFILVSFTSNPTKQDNIHHILKENSIYSINQITEKYYEIGYECEITSWSQLHRFNQWFDLVKLSKFEIEPSDSKISTSYEIKGNKNQITLHFTDNYDVCIVETMNKKTAYRIVNDDVAESIFKQGHERSVYWPIWNDELAGSVNMNSYVSLIEGYKNNEFEWKKCAFVQIDMSGSEGDCYIIKGNYECNENQLTIISFEDNNKFVFDIEIDGYDSLLKINESQSQIEAKEMLDILRKMKFTSNFDEIYNEVK